MSWFLSLAIGVLTAICGGLGAFVLGERCVRWYRISSFEGGAGYFVMFLCLAGLVAGLIVGIVCSRFVVPGEREFLRGLGCAVGSLAALLFVIGVFCRLSADLRPTIDGKYLELAVEVRCPEGFVIPTQVDQHGAFAGVYALRGRHQPTGELRLGEATQQNGRWIIPATVPLQTSASRKFLRVHFNQENDPMVPLPLRARPNRNDLEWSRWIEAAWDASEPEPAAEQKFNVRYRVQVIEPRPPGPTFAEIKKKQAAEEQAAFDAIPSTAPITAWLPYTRYGLHEGRLRAAVQRIAERPEYVSELAVLMHSPEQQVAVDALRVVEHLPQPSPELAPAVADVGRELAMAIRKVNTISVEEDPSYFGAADVAVRFSAWMTAVRTLRTKCGGDFTPELGTILELSRVREDSYVMQVDVRRVASYYMHEWAGLQPLAGDPKPR